MWGEHPIAVSSHSDILNAMEPIRSTDYFAVIAKTHGIGLLEPTIPGPIAAQAIHQHAVADLSIVALVITTAILVTTVILNWSR